MGLVHILDILLSKQTRSMLYMGRRVNDPEELSIDGYIICDLNIILFVARSMMQSLMGPSLKMRTTFVRSELRERDFKVIR